MDYDALRYLDLAGVRWELADTPITAPAPSVTKQAPTGESVFVPRATDPTRRVTSVVPPIAPIQTISLETATAMASRPNDMNALVRMIGEFGHPLRSGATNTVLPHVASNPNGLLIVTDIPGTDDDASGCILSGASGELMDKMLSAINMSRENVSIVPMLFWRTPGGRTPTREELDLSRPFFNRALDLLHPRVILTLGTLPAMELIGVNLAKSHGVPVVQDNGRTVVPIFHPNYLILKPAAKRDVWNALQNVENILKSIE